MKTELLFLSLPVAATMINLLVAYCILGRSTAKAQPVIHDIYVNRDQRCLGGLGDCAHFDVNTFQEQEEPDDLLNNDEEQDPMLKEMPGKNGFKAYVRADISSFYQEPPGSRVEVAPRFHGQAFKVVNMSPERVSLYWIDDSDVPHFHGYIGPWAAQGSSTFPGHKFAITKPKHFDDVICWCPIVKGTSVYYCNPFVENDPNDPAHLEYVGESPRLLEDLAPLDRADYEAHLYNIEFAKLYKNFTGGSEWLTMWPRDPPRHKMWRADYFGQEHHITSDETHFLAVPPKLSRMSIDQMRHPKDYSDYRASGPMNMTIKALSCAPRAFEIRDFLSEFEADHMLETVQHMEMTRSSVGRGEQSSVRTSRTTWIPRNTDPILNAIYRRAADVLRINEALFRKRMPGEVPDYELLEPINEDIQIVHYDKGQEYTAHHDFGYPQGEINSPSRSINLCLYLNNVTKGGTTSFPRWRNGHTSESIDVVPEKTKAMIFYMINPDGNLDDLTQHAAMPVLEGEKWFANLWIHDPYFSRSS